MQTNGNIILNTYRPHRWSFSKRDRNEGRRDRRCRAARVSECRFWPVLCRGLWRHKGKRCIDRKKKTIKKKSFTQKRKKPRRNSLPKDARISLTHTTTRRNRIVLRDGSISYPEVHPPTIFLFGRKIVCTNLLRSRPAAWSLPLTGANACSVSLANDKTLSSATSVSCLNFFTGLGIMSAIVDFALYGIWKHGQA